MSESSLVFDGGNGASAARDGELAERLVREHALGLAEHLQRTADDLQEGQP